MKAIKSHVLPLLLVSILVGAVLLPGVGGGFVFDDYPNIVDNKAIHVSSLDWRDWAASATSSPASNLPRPLAMLSFSVNHFFTGLDPVPFKLTNIAIHIFNMVLVFGLIKCLLRASYPIGETEPGRQSMTALFVAATWALHPINMMPALFIVQRMEALSHTFVFLGLWLYLLGRLRLQQGLGYPWILMVTGTVGLTVAGVLSKESAALLPLYAGTIELIVFRFRDGSGKLSPKIALLFALVLLLPALVGGIWLVRAGLDPVSYAGRDFTLWERLLTEPRVIIDYLSWIILPDLNQLSLYHDDYLVSRGLLDPISTLVSILAIGTLLFGSLFLRHRIPLISLGAIWFFSAHALTATFLPLELAFEHRNYFASLGICLIAGVLLFPALARRDGSKIRSVAAIALVFVLSGLTMLRAAEWRNAVTFAASEAAKRPNSPRATYYFGWVLSNATGYDKDSPLISPALAALDHARSLPNSNILPDQAALILSARSGLPLQESWWRHMETQLRERPIGPQETGALGGLVTCEMKGLCKFPPDQMVRMFSAALGRGPHPEVLNVYGNYALNVLGDPALARDLWLEAKARTPGEPQYRIAIIKLDIAQGRAQEARRGIAELRSMGRLGQYSRLADELEARALSASSIPAPRLEDPD